MPATLFNCLASCSDSSAVIIPSPEIHLSHSQLLAQVLSFQQKLAALGIGPKDAVAIVFPNTIEFVIAFLAVAFQRSVCAPLNPAYKQDEFEFYLEDLEAAVILVPREDVAGNKATIKAAEKCKVDVAEIFWDGSEVQINLVQQGNKLAGRQTSAVEKPKEDDIALVLHTSGTTGRPKGVSLTILITFWKTAKLK